MLPKYHFLLFVSIFLFIQMFPVHTSVTQMCGNMLYQLGCRRYSQEHVPTKCQVLLKFCSNDSDSGCPNHQEGHIASTSGTNNNTSPSYKLLILATHKLKASESWLYDTKSTLISPYINFPPAINAYLYIPTEAEILISTETDIMLFQLSIQRIRTIHENIKTNNFGFDERRGIVFFFLYTPSNQMQLVKLFVSNKKIEKIRKIRTTGHFTTIAVLSPERLLYITCRYLHNSIKILNFKGIFKGDLKGNHHGLIVSSYIEGMGFYFISDQRLYKWSQDYGSTLLVVTDRALKEIVILNSTLFTTSTDEGQVSVLDTELGSFTELRLHINHDSVGILGIKL